MLVATTDGQRQIVRLPPDKVIGRQKMS